MGCRKFYVVGNYSVNYLISVVFDQRVFILRHNTLLYGTQKNEPGEMMMPLTERKQETRIILGVLDFLMTQ